MTSGARRATRLAVTAFVVLVLVGCTAREPDGVSSQAGEQGNEQGEDQPEEATVPQGAEQETLAEGIVTRLAGVQVGVREVDGPTVVLDLSTDLDGAVVRLAAGHEVQVGTSLVGVQQLGGGSAVVWALADQPPLEGAVLFPVPGQRSFGAEAGLQTELSDAQQARLAVRTDPDAGVGRGWEFAALPVEPGAVAELAGYRAEVQELVDGGAMVLVTAPDGATLPRATPPG